MHTLIHYEYYLYVRATSVRTIAPISILYLAGSWVVDTEYIVRSE